ncbi:MAG: AtpZ/AtpI family protein [Planctomycetota bacterium]|jgi:F0F1-type ATP synthase assembly protein I
MARQPGKGRPQWIRHAGVGIEFAAAVAGFGLVGYWIDAHYATGPWGLLIGVALGLIGGTYNLIRESMAAFKRLEEEKRNRNSEQGRN